MTNRRGGRRPTAGSTVLAFLVAPLATLPVTGVVLVCSWLLGLGAFRDAATLALLTSLLTLTAFALPAAYAATAVPGIPAYIAARRFGFTGLGHCQIIGAAVALLPLWAYFAFVAAVEGLRVTGNVGTAICWTVLFAACGASSGAVFWRIGLR